MRLIDIFTKSTPVYLHDKLLYAFTILSEKLSPYRVPVIDEKFTVEGVISGRRILEILVGRRGEALERKKGIKNVFDEPVSLFIDEVYNIFTDSVDLDTVIQYMAENKIGYVFIVDQSGVFKGVIDDKSILKKLIGKSFNMKVEEVMCSEVYSVLSNATLNDALAIMMIRSIRRLPIIENQILSGIITATDILNHVFMHEKHVGLSFREADITDALKSKVQDVMSKPLAIEPWQEVGQAIDKIVENNVSGLPAVSAEGKLSGIITRLDLVTKLVNAKGAISLINMMGNSI